MQTPAPLNDPEVLEVIKLISLNANLNVVQDCENSKGSFLLLNVRW